MDTHRGAPTVLGRLETVLSGIITGITITSLIAIVVIVFVSVVLRYVFNIALIFSYDISTILFAWLVFLGLYVAERDGAHMGIDLITSLEPSPFRTAIILLKQIILLAAGIYLAWIGFMLMLRTGTQIPSLRISARWLYAALPIGFGLLSLAYFLQLVRTLRPRSEA
jgi:TRAP-type C4-dicarboxylate transport system permease small subunit